MSPNAVPNHDHSGKSVSWVLLALALVVTPWLIFISTSLALLLNNQADLGNYVELLYPYLGIAVGVYSVGLILALAAPRSRVAHAGLFLYLLLGLGFIGFQMARNFLPASALLLVSIAACATTVYCALHPLKRSRIIAFLTPLLALLAVSYVALDAYRYFRTTQTHPVSELQVKNNTNTHAPTAVSADPYTEIRASGAKHPNIYHLMLDEYQYDIFQTTLTGSIERDLSGFTLFADTRALFGRTEMSLASIFSGQRFNFQEPPLEYQRRAFSDALSLLGMLKKNGYRNEGILHPVYSFPLAGFDHVAQHSEYTDAAIANTYSMFHGLWLYATFTDTVARQILPPLVIDQIRNKTLLPPTAPVMSYHSMRRALGDEVNKPMHNRYFYIHLILPHYPYVLDAQCQHQGDKKTSVQEQASCTTQLIVRLIEELKDLGRFEDSIIIVQSDHGAKFEVQTDGSIRGLPEKNKIRFTPRWSNARSQALLMIKPAGVDASQSLVVSDLKASLIDVLPTLAGLLQIPTPQGVDGIDLMAPDVDTAQREREYYFYNKRGTQGRHFIDMTRYRVEGAGLVKEGLVGDGEFK